MALPKITLPKRDYRTLDAILVIGAMVLIGRSINSLMTIENIPSDRLPIIAALLGTLLGTVIGGYAGFRWGASIAGGNTAITKNGPATAGPEVHEE